MCEINQLSWVNFFYKNFILLVEFDLFVFGEIEIVLI